MADGTINIPGIGETKKTYVYVGLAVVAGVVGYAWYAHKQAAASVLPADGTTYSEDYAGLSGGGSGGTTTGGLGGSTGSPDASSPDPDILPPKTNIEWSNRVTRILTEKFGYDGQMVGATIGKYLARIGLTSAEKDLIRTAWGQLGRPPEGDFPLIDAPVTQQPPPGTTDGTKSTPEKTNPTPTTTTPKQYTDAFQLSVKAGSQVIKFTDAIRNRAGFDIDWGIVDKANPTLGSDINWGPSGSKDLTIRTFKYDRTYYIPSVPKP